MLTKRQKELMEHTLSSINRNWFATENNSDDAKEFRYLVEQGLATSEEATKWMGDDVVFRLTDKGLEALNNVDN
jgi:hypothetical protein